MNQTRFFAQLLRSLRVPTNALPGEDPDLQTALVSALQAYSRYRPALRRVGTGTLLQAVGAGGSSLYIMGGPFPQGAVGQSLVLDALGFTPETVGIQSIATAEIGENEAAQTCLKLTLTAPLASDHAAGAFVTPGLPGLKLLAGVDTYALPTDWISVDEQSFSLATGQRQSPVRQSGYYDGAYRQSARLSGLGYAQRANFGAGNGISGVGVAGAFGVPVACGDTQYRFVDDAPARLIVSPAPSSNRALDFYYHGCHTAQSVPESDSDAVLAYACYTALLAEARVVARKVDRTAGDEKSVYSKSHESLLQQAQEALAIFDSQVVNRPFTSGG